MKAEGIKSVAAAALGRWETVASAIDEKFRVAGDEVVMLNPRRDDRARNSFSFNRHTGAWKDFAAASDAAGADLVSLWAYCRNLDQGAAADDLAAHLRLDPDSLPAAPKRKQEEARLPMPVPPEALSGIPRFLAWANTSRNATGEHWIVRNLDGQALLLRVRCEAPGQKKTVLPFTWSPEKAQWMQGGNFAPLFYGLERLKAAPGAGVLLVEGEKTADAAQALFPELVALAFMGADTVRKVDVAPLFGREVVLWPDADAPGLEAARTMATRISQCGNRVRLVDLPETIKAWAKPGKTAPGGWDLADPPPAGVDLQALLHSAAVVDLRSKDSESAAPAALSDLPTRAGCYLIRDGQMVVEKSDGAISTLSNFAARVTEELVLDDGETEELLFLVEGALADGTSLPVVRVPAASFSGLTWIMAQWGMRAIVTPGITQKDHLRAAIQYLSRPARRRAFLNTGWRKLDGRWCFLHAGGALGPDGPMGNVDVDLKGRLALFTLAPPLHGQDLSRAFRSSSRTLDLGPGAVTAPVWLAAFRAVVDDCPFSLHISGSKGTGKTELASIAAGHFGPGLEAKETLESWESTSGALERALFLAKDVLGLVDDFRPQGGPRETADLFKKADRILRGAFNRASRSRLSSDAKTQRAAFWSRGLILSTGEDLPDGESLRSRVLCLEWAPQNMEWTVLGRLQEDRAEGLHAGLMASFIQWQAQDRERILKIRLEARDKARRTFRETGDNRTGDIAAELWSAWPVLDAFAREQEILPIPEIEGIGRRLLSFILEMTGAQASIISEASPAERFREGLTACLESGRGHLANGEMGSLPNEWESRCGWHDNQAKGPRLGYLSVKKREVWLIPSAAFQEASRLVTLGTGEKALWARLRDAGWLALEREGRNRARRILPDGGRPDFIVVHLDRLWDLGHAPLEGQNGSPIIPLGTSAIAKSGAGGTIGARNAYLQLLAPAAGDDWGTM